MPSKKRSTDAPRETGEQLAKVALARRKKALRRRKAAIAKMPKTKAAKSASPAVKAGQSAGILVAEGDSWFDYPFNDIIKNLEDDHGFDVETVAHAGDRVEDMAYSGGQLDDFIRRIEKLKRRGEKPRAILLSGGGNDITGEIEFGMILNHALSPINGLNPLVVEGIIDQRLHDAFSTILAAVTTVCEEHFGEKIPIVVHGYDYAIPDGRGFAGGFWLLPGPWLEPGFNQKGYHNMVVRRQLVEKLIDRFNEMLKRLTGTPEFRHVSFVDLRRTLKSANYKTDWANELHPTATGFAAVTARIAAAIP
ncbi:hypothetical protein JI752_006825 [Lysobacter sp. MMG2]|uniref:SGNH/GDSL hydrolase family protein n=1 Tax=Lysobacter sp. MMG2 TaxID=2801338 RepID=UPI001C213A07|nr:SGNH/GDSL hydrolase family protein [Lysobacter sp. MMG2]MBU8975853.1 hypothetical protein [Lysobacter sp. MMG2]